MKYADYIEQIEIESLWSGTKHILWNLDRKVNILSGINGVGKSTILSKVIRGLAQGGEFPSHLLKGVHLKVKPEDAKWIRYDVIRSFDRPLVNTDSLSQIENLITELDWQLFLLQRKYLDYQVNVGNRIIEVLQSGAKDAALQAQSISEGKKMFQDIIDDLFKETGKTIIRTENEIRFSQLGEVLRPYQLSSGEKQMLAILLTVLVEDRLPYVLFMDETAHRTQSETQPERATHSRNPQSGRHHERLDGPRDRGDRHHVVGPIASYGTPTERQYHLTLC